MVFPIYHPHQYPFIRDDPKYRCICGVHVEKAAFVIAILGCMINFSLTTAAIFEKPSAIAGFVFHGLLYLCILFAQKNRNPSLYLPYLIICGIRNVVLLIGYSVLVIVLLGVAFLEAEGKDPKGILVSLAVIVGVGMITVIPLWFYSLVWRAWKFMKAEMAWKKCLSTAATTNPNVTFPSPPPPPPIYGATADGLLVPEGHIGQTNNNNTAAVYPPSLYQPTNPGILTTAIHQKHHSSNNKFIFECRRGKDFEINYEINYAGR